MGPYLVCLTRMSRQVAVPSEGGHLCACYVVQARIAAEPDPVPSSLLLTEVPPGADCRRSRLSMRPPDPVPIDVDRTRLSGPVRRHVCERSPRRRPTAISRLAVTHQLRAGCGGLDILKGL